MIGTMQGTDELRVDDASGMDDQGTRIILISRIDRHPDNPREQFDEEDLQRLARSIKRRGLLQPLVVRAARGNSPDRYQLVAGERRLQASKRAGLAFVPCRVMTLNDAEAIEVMGIENLLREDLNAIETAKLLSKLCGDGDQLNKRKSGGPTRTLEEAGEIFGKSAQWVCYHLNFLKLPEAWQQRIRTKEISYSSALTLLPYRDNPELLATIEADMVANPLYWDGCTAFKRSVKLLADGRDRDKARGGRPSAPRAKQAGSGLKPATKRDRADVDEGIDEGDQVAIAAPAPSPGLVAELLAAVAMIDTVEELDELAQGIASRRAELAARYQDASAGT